MDDMMEELIDRFGDISEESTAASAYCSSERSGSFSLCDCSGTERTADPFRHV